MNSMYYIYKLQRMVIVLLNNEQFLCLLKWDFFRLLRKSIEINAVVAMKLCCVCVYAFCLLLHWIHSILIHLIYTIDFLRNKRCYKSWKSSKKNRLKIRSQSYNWWRISLDNFAFISGKTIGTAKWNSI